MSASNDNVEQTTSDSATGGTQITKAVRRSSFRESIMAEANMENTGGEKAAVARRGSLTGESTNEVKRQLLVERSNYEKLMVQMLVLTNDLNEREDQIIAMKKREAVFEEQLASKEKMYEQDAKVRMQLGKRLEDVLMDKEEIKDELDNLKVLSTPTTPFLRPLLCIVSPVNVYQVMYVDRGCLSWPAHHGQLLVQDD